MNSYVNMGAGALLGTVFVLMSVSIASEGIFHSEAPEKEGFAIIAEEPSAEGGEGAAETAAVPIATLLASADAGAGEAAFKKCQACHSGEKGGPNKVGPDLWDIVNRPIAVHEGFSYSAAMKTFSEGGKQVWDFEHLNHFLTAPKQYIPGTAMGFAGLKKDDERANLIAYLRTLSDNPAPLPEASPEGAAATPAAEGGAGEGAAPAEDGAATQGGTEGSAPAAETPAENGGGAAAPAEDNGATGTAPAEGAAPEGSETAPAAQ
ncbi:MAG: cytochrome c family protein [Shinella sp.]|nr:cytochrome c family protein [Shinella sp.]